MDRRKLKNQILIYTYIIVTTAFCGTYVKLRECLKGYANKTYTIGSLICLESIFPVLAGVLFAITLMKIRRGRGAVFAGLAINMIAVGLVWHFSAAISAYNLIFIGVLLYMLFNRKGEP